MGSKFKALECEMVKYDVSGFDIQITAEPSGIQVVHAELDLQSTTGDNVETVKKYRLCSDTQVDTVQDIMTIINTNSTSTNQVMIREFEGRSHVTFMFDDTPMQFTGIEL
ncbi:hypothetical protein ACU5EH_01040 [Aliivibrio salmonicida]|uniref:hypothetical protein n=1 Tax=Aliivibrio salmonicida TaxID=40269 RepID=UPI00406D1015